MNEEVNKMTTETQLDILAMSNLRISLAKEANQKIGNIGFKDVFPDVNKQEELACMIKLLVPKALRPTLLSSTLTSTIRRRHTLDKERSRKELQMLTNDNHSKPQSLIALTT